MKVLITGTHFTTAVATVEELKKFPNIELLYVGRRTTLEGDPSVSVESKELPKLGVKFIPITSGRLRRNLIDIYTITSILKIPVGFIQAFFIVLGEHPDAVLSFGGYLALPVVFAAWLFSIPVIIHEQTLVMGLANKISSPFADKIAVSFEQNHTSGDKYILTGNPIRREITQGVKLPHPFGSEPQGRRPGGVLSRHPGLPLILITGGNQGSHVINKAVEDCLENLLRVAYVIHQTGDSKFKDYERLEAKQNKHYVVRKWIDDIGAVLSKVDFVISRAGINTLSELAYLGIPALVIPVPYLYQDEQNKNAKYFEKLGLVRILPQSKLFADSLLENVKLMITDLDKLKVQAKGTKEVIIADASKRLALEVVTLTAKAK